MELYPFKANIPTKIAGISSFPHSRDPDTLTQAEATKDRKAFQWIVTRFA
jgi:hypothetical protein